MTANFLQKVVLSSLCLCALSCGISDNAKKATDNSGRAADNSARAADSAEQSREEIANSRIAQRTSKSSASRREALTALMEMKSFDMKLTEASKFVKAFEYQYWSGQKYDTREYLERLYDDAMREFFRAVVEIYDGKSIVGADISPFRLDITKQRDLDFNVLALAAGMHGLSNMQELVTIPKVGHENKALSVYELIKRALVKAKNVDDGSITFDTLLPHEKTVFYYRKEAVALMNARVNMFLTLALTKVSNIKRSTADAAGLLLAKKSYDTNYFKLNLGEQDHVNRFIGAAAKVVVFMESIGLKPKYRDDVSSLYKQMRFPKQGSQKLSKESGQAIKNHAIFLGLMGQMFTVGEERFSTKK